MGVSSIMKNIGIVKQYEQEQLLVTIYFQQDMEIMEAEGWLMQVQIMVHDSTTAEVVIFLHKK